MLARADKSCSSAWSLVAGLMCSPSKSTLFRVPLFTVKIVQDEALYPFQSEAILQYAAAIERVEQFVSIFTFFTANEISTLV